MSRKVVINKCYGGFGLSTLAIKEYMKLKGKQVYFYKADLTDFKNIKYKKINESKDGIFIFCFTKDFGENFCYTDVANNELNEYSFNSKDIKRDDKDLVKVVEKLQNNSNTMCSDLKIVEIPEDIEWQIEEYDGNEWISEKHRTWA